MSFIERLRALPRIAGRAMTAACDLILGEPVYPGLVPDYKAGWLAHEHYKEWVSGRFDREATKGSRLWDLHDGQRLYPTEVATGEWRAYKGRVTHADKEEARAAAAERTWCDERTRCPACHAPLTVVMRPGP